MLRSGHAPGHVREAFLNAAHSFMSWQPGTPEPTVDFEVGYVPRQIPLSKLCGLLWNCTDIMPGISFSELSDAMDIKRQTYAACARAMLAAIKR